MKLGTTVRRIRNGAAAVALAGVMMAGTVTTADAAASHHNTDPYLTGCAQGAVVIGGKNVPGGKVVVAWSPSCQTNFVEYSGTKQWTTKRISSPRGSTTKEKDNASWSYSMQAYAPGTTPVSGYVVVRGKTYKFACSNGCSWS